MEVRKYLSDLDFSTFDHEYSYGNVVTNGLTSTALSGGSVIYPLISPVKQWYYDSTPTSIVYTDTLANIDYAAGDTQGILYTELKPAVKVMDIFTAIATLLMMCS